MAAVKASCNTGNSAWAIVKSDILLGDTGYFHLDMKEKNANFITTVMKEPNILQKHTFYDLLLLVISFYKTYYKLQVVS